MTLVILKTMMRLMSEARSLRSGKVSLIKFKDREVTMNRKMPWKCMSLIRTSRNVSRRRRLEGDIGRCQSSGTFKAAFVVALKRSRHELDAMCARNLVIGKKNVRIGLRKERVSNLERLIQEKCTFAKWKSSILRLVMSLSMRMLGTTRTRRDHAKQLQK